MNILHLREIGNATRLGALCSSLIAVLMFGIAFATEKQLPYHIERFLTGHAEELGTAVLFGLLLSTFLGYLVAISKKFAIFGSMLSICSVGAIYACCQLFFNFFPSPFLIVMIGPALLHVLALQMCPPYLQSKFVATQNEVASSVNTHGTSLCEASMSS